MIEDYVLVGARAIILPDVTIGYGAVVTQDVEQYQILAGVSERPIGQRRSNLTYTLDNRKYLG
jgi:maltose O-acetyltransferase